MNIDDMNKKIDILFDQIDNLKDDKYEKAMHGLAAWKMAKTASFMGLGPIEARCEYKDAYNAFVSLGLEVGGMIKPYEY